MTRVHLVRHGEVHNPDNVVYGLLPGFELSAEGEQQAKSAAGHLSERPIAAIYSSPLERAQSTAKFISDATGAGISLRDELIEWRLGEHWEGLSWAEIPRSRPEEWDAYMHRPDEMEFLEEPLELLAKRMAGAVREISFAHVDQETVVVSHADPIKAAVLALTGSPLGEIHETSLPTGSIVTMEFESGRVVERWP